MGYDTCCGYNTARWCFVLGINDSEIMIYVEVFQNGEIYGLYAVYDRLA